MKRMQIRKILVPIDFSQCSIRALHLAADIARQHQAELHLLYIDDCDYTLYTDDETLRPPRNPEYMKTLVNLAKMTINSLEVQCSYSAETTAVSYGILKTARNRYADLIVMGKNGNNGPSGNYAGTHALQVAEKSRIPVLLVPEQAVKNGFHQILFPARPLLSVPEKYDAVRQLLLKQRPAITLFLLRNPAYENELHIIHRLSLMLKEKLETDGMPYRLEHYFRDPHFADAVLDEMSDPEKNYDLAIITAETDRLNREFHLGAYAQTIIHRCAIPILLLRPEKARLDKQEILERLSKTVMMN
ncbi:MAG TPA: universal stress protein [Sediminibacterium sp.]|nr:universal stress protein [Sediminibacterium sp.]